MRQARLASSLLPLLFAGCHAGLAHGPYEWQHVATGTTASLRGLVARDARHVVVGGSDGTLLATDDGGRTWRDIAPPGSDGCDFRDLAFVDGALLALVAGQPARVYRSEAADGNWVVVHEDARKAAFFDAMAFDGAQGVLFGDAIDGAFCLLATADGGRSWSDSSAAVLPAPVDGEAAFAASGTCLVARTAGTGGYSLVTGGAACRHVAFAVDGRAGAVHELPLMAGAASCGAFSISWQGRRAVVVGGDYSRPRLGGRTAAYSRDDGRTWQPADAGGYRSAVTWLGGDSVLAVGSHGCSQSADGGATWLPFGSVGFHSVVRAADGAVWACGSDGRVARLTSRDRAPAATRR